MFLSINEIKYYFFIQIIFLNKNYKYERLKVVKSYLANFHNKFGYQTCIQLKKIYLETLSVITKNEGINSIKSQFRNNIFLDGNTLK